MNPNIKKKTFAVIVKKYSDYKILDFLSHISKNIYNSTIFHTNLYKLYKQSLFKLLFQIFDNDKQIITQNIIKQKILLINFWKKIKLKNFLLKINLMQKF